MCDLVDYTKSRRPHGRKDVISPQGKDRGSRKGESQGQEFSLPLETVIVRDT